ncbi:MAG: peptidoglycan D,D-transpeptidase FtsI family protein [Rhizomicrobium sp.]
MAAKPPTAIQRRIVVAAGLCVLAFSVLGIRLVDLGLLKGRQTGTGIADSIAPVVRADIVDRNGRLLARDLPVFDLYARPHVFWDKSQAAHELAAATGASEQRLARAFAGKHNYVLVASQITPVTREKVMHLGLPALEFEPSTKRYYPEDDARQVIGVTQAVSGGRGITGLEKGLNAQLAAGKPAQLSLDMRVQYALVHAVGAAREKYSARAAGGIVMNVNTGEVLAMASLQDPKNPGYDPLRNIMAADDYELGSVFKIFAFALALEDHTITFDKTFPVGSGFKIGKYTIHDAERMPAVMMAKDILAQSSNAGTAQIALLSGPDRQRAWMQNLGLLQSTHTEIPERARPLYPSNWGQVETATIGFGHGISVTPLAFVTAAASIVNGGRRIEPTFLKQTGDRRGAQILKPETSQEMRTLLRYVVTNGTGKSADIPGLDVGGKTGSAEKNVHGRYIAHKLVTSFCAVFPIDNPRYLVFVMLDEPHGESAVMALAGHTAAPLAGDVIAHIAPMLEMPAAVPVSGKGNS